MIDGDDSVDIKYLSRYVLIFVIRRFICLVVVFVFCGIII